MALRAQQLRSCVMIVSPSRLCVRALAVALVLAACEDVRADGDAAEDGDTLYRLVAVHVAAGGGV